MAAVETLLANHSPQEYTVLSALSSASCGEFMFSVVCIMTAVCVCVCVCVCVVLINLICNPSKVYACTHTLN